MGLALRNATILTMNDAGDVVTGDLWIEGDRIAAVGTIPPEVTPDTTIDAGGALVHQTAVFEPTGLSGRLYWYMLLPVHAMIFGGMLRQIAQRARGGRK